MGTTRGTSRRRRVGCSLGGRVNFGSETRRYGGDILKVFWGVNVGQQENLGGYLEHNRLLRPFHPSLQSRGEAPKSSSKMYRLCRVASLDHRRHCETGGRGNGSVSVGYRCCCCLDIVDSFCSRRCSRSCSTTCPGVIFVVNASTIAYVVREENEVRRMVRRVGCGEPNELNACTQHAVYYSE